MPWKPNKIVWASVTALASLGFVLAASAAQVGPPAAPLQRPIEAAGVPMKHYKSAQWDFALDVPARWNAFPAQSVNPGEVIRFVSVENGNHLLVVMREAHDPKESPQAFLERIQQEEAKGGFAHFVTGKLRVGAREAMTLDFDKPQPDGKISSGRAYFIIDGALIYTLGFGTTADPTTEFPLYDRIARSFTFAA